MHDNVQALGDVLALARNSGVAIQDWLRSVDESLESRLRSAAAARGESVSEFVRIAIADFLTEAEEEDWAGLLSATRSAEDPAAAAFVKMTMFRLTLEADA